MAYTEFMARAKSVSTNQCSAGQHFYPASPCPSVSSLRQWQCPCSIMCPAFSQPACVASFSCPLPLSAWRSCLALGQLSDAHWPNSARPSTNSLRRGNTRKALPLQCSYSWANVCGFSGGASVTTDTQQLHNLVFCLFQHCTVIIWKWQCFQLSFLHCILPQTCFFDYASKYIIKHEKTKHTYTVKVVDLQ